jgi:hypothetical protein
MNLRTLGSAAAAIGLAAGISLTQAAGAYAGAPVYYWQNGHTYEFISWSPDPTGTCLDDSNTGTGGSDNLRAFACNSTGYQRWTVSQTDGEWAQLTNDATNRCLDLSIQNGTPLLRTFGCNDASFDNGYQAWELVNRTAPDGGAEAVLESGLNGGAADLCVDVSTYGTRGFPCNGASQDNGYQSWTPVDVTNS